MKRSVQKIVASFSAGGFLFLPLRCGLIFLEVFFFLPLRCGLIFLEVFFFSFHHFLFILLITAFLEPRSPLFYEVSSSSISYLFLRLFTTARFDPCSVYT
jgi:hypothetical protein